MKIAVPTRDGRVDDHFGHCEYYTIFDIIDGKITNVYFEGGCAGGREAWYPVGTPPGRSSRTPAGGCGADHDLQGEHPQSSV